MLDPLTKRQTQVAGAAGPVFLSQGFAATTMADIARAAGLSRQGLYLAFPNKDAVFTAAVMVLDDALHFALDEGLDRNIGLRPRLSFVCDRWLGSVFDLKRATPEAADMDNLAFPVVRLVYDRFIALVARLIAQECGDTLAHGAITDLATTLVFGIRGFSATAADRSDMRRMMTLQVDLVTGHVSTLTASAPAVCPTCGKIARKSLTSSA